MSGAVPDSHTLPIELIMRPSKPHGDHMDKSASNDQLQKRDSVPSRPPVTLPSGVGQGLLIRPRNRRAPSTNQPKRSNLAALLEGQPDGSRSFDESGGGMVTPLIRNDSSVDNSYGEGDSASGPTRETAKARSAPPVTTAGSLGNPTAPPPDAIPSSIYRPRVLPLSASAGRYMAIPTKTQDSSQPLESPGVRRCISSKELGTLAPPSGSPFSAMLYQREILQATLQQRLMDARESTLSNDRSLTPSPGMQDASDCSESSKTREKKAQLLSNERRNRRRAAHNKAVTNDLCEIVTDLFVAEAKLLKAANYGLDTSLQRDHVLKNVMNFVSALPPRYALGVDTPSEVLLHMRLMAAARADHTRAVVHITKTGQSTNLVTISCADAQGLLEYITRMLATGGSRVLDADVMLSTDNIVLDRFVVQMKGRLRLDKLSQSIEAFLVDAHHRSEEDSASSEKPSPDRSPASMQRQASGPLYFHAPKQMMEDTSEVLQQEIDSAVPLSEVLASSSKFQSMNNLVPMRRTTHTDNLRRGNSMPPAVMQPFLSTPDGSSGESHHTERTEQIVTEHVTRSTERHHRRLVNREATLLGDSDEEVQHPPVDYLTVRQTSDFSDSAPLMEDRIIPLIPFEELMLIETLGTGRVSTIYRAAWQRRPVDVDAAAALTGVEMVALKVATVNMETGDTMHVDELRREADIAAMLKHPNVCDLVGVAADAECFCLAYEFCEAGSVLSLLTDTARYYEYLPIALDIANGMAYLHSRQVIHRDLKPSNVLLTRDHRAKIADFGMSVANRGQELTAETGTYRYMAPEVIRHESYSSNADVYSFGILLWQLITREVPFATMTPIQAAFSVAEGRRPEIPGSTPRRLAEIISACWDQDSHKRPSFTYIAMALADYARMAFSPANVGAQTLQIANEMLATVEGNSTINVDFSTPVTTHHADDWNHYSQSGDSDIGLDIE